MGDMTIRHATPGDVAVIADFNQAMALETEHLELARERLEAGVRSLIDDPSKGFYLLAEKGGEVVGQMMLTYEWSDWRNGLFWWIQSVYVRPENRRQGVYRGLYEHSVDSAKAAFACGLRLYVERRNLPARRTYERLGMSATVYEMYETDFVIER